MSAQNPIVVENQQPGSPNWQIPYSSSADDVTGQIKGYAGATSVNKGQSIAFYVSVNPAQTYTIDVYRVGWYQGLGARLMQHIGPLSGVKQATCPTDSTTGEIECQWSVSYTLNTQTTWTSGIYLALLTNAQGYMNYIEFTLRDDSRAAALLFQHTVTTFQAYNDYPYDQQTGKSLYQFNSYGPSTVSAESPGAAKVSFDRPYASDGTGLNWGNSLLKWEVPFIHWMEMSGYDVTYQTDLDTHLNPSGLLKYLGLLSVGHDEYWSKPMYDGWVAALNAGVNLGFFGSNEIWWQVRFESSSTGVPNRIMVCYKDPTIDPISDLTLKTSLWRDAPLNRPAQGLAGVLYTSQTLWSAYQSTDSYAPYVVSNATSWVYAGTGFKNGDSVPGIVGYEADRFFSQYPSPSAVNGTYMMLSNSSYQSNPTGVDTANASIYQASSGAWVFAAGTMGWSNGLDNFAEPSFVDARIQKTTANILNRFITPQNNFAIAASPSSQTITQGGSTSYTVTITPSGSFSGQVTLSVSGLPTGATPTFSPNPTATSSTLSVVTATSTPAGTYTLTITGTSAALTHTTTTTLIVSQLPDFTLSASPASQAINPGGTANYTLTINPIAGFNSPVTLSVTSALPTGATPGFSPNPTATSSTFTLGTTTSTPTGTYTITIQGVSGALTHTTTVQLVVSTPDFALAASPSIRTISPGGSTTYTVTITPIAGFAGQVTLSVGGLPANTTGTFNPNPASSSSTLSVTTNTTAAAGTYSLTITGTSGVLAHSVTVSLTLTPPGVKFDNTVSSNFLWGVNSVITPPLTIGTGTKRAAMILVAMYENTATNIIASLGGVAATLIPGTDTGTSAGLRTLIFCVTNPPSGSQTATVSWVNNVDADVGIVTVSGADQTTPCTNGTFVRTTNTQLISNASVTITSSTGDLTASVGITTGEWVAPFTNQTLKWGIDNGEAGGDIGPGTGTTTHTWTDQWPEQIRTVSGANFTASVTP